MREIRPVSRETSLFAEAEAREQRVEHILDPRAPGKSIEGAARHAKLLGSNDECRSPPHARSASPRLAMQLGLAPIERHRILARKTASAACRDDRSSNCGQALAGHRRHRMRPSGATRRSGRSAFANGPGSERGCGGASVRIAQPQQDFGALDQALAPARRRSPRPARRFRAIRRCRSARIGIPASASGTSI